MSTAIKKAKELFGDQPRLMDALMRSSAYMRVAKAMITGVVPSEGEFGYTGNLSLSHFEERHFERVCFIQSFGFSIPCKEAVDALVGLGPILEVGCGTGYWTHLLRKVGGDCIATDVERMGVHTDFGQTVGTWALDMSISGEAAMRRFSDRNVFVSWPYMNEPWQVQMLEAMKDGRRFAMIGEGPGGCTACDRVFRSLDERFELEQHINIPQFDGLSDYLGIWRKGPSRLKRASLDPRRLP